MAFNYFYKQFETIRIIIRRLYLYGCYSRDDFKNIVSGRKFDNELKRAKMVLSPDNIVQTYKGKSKYTSINHDYFIEENNILYNTYLAKAFKQNEFLLYFYILQTLDDIPLSLSEVEMNLSEFIPDIDRATIRNHLDKMCDEGYLISTILKNKKMYALAPDVLSGITRDEYSELLNAVSFYMNTRTEQMAGQYCYDTIREASNINHRIPFVFKHKFLHQILDEEVLQEILSAIDKKKSINFEYNGSKRENITPYKIKEDLYFGRQYLIGFNISNSRLSIFRIDKISNVEKSDIYAEISDDISKYCWCVSWKPTHESVSITFDFNHLTDEYLIRRLYRDKQHGKIEKTSESTYVFSIEITDPIEMVPYLRTFYGHIVKTNCAKLNDYINEDLKRMVALYEDF